MRLRLSLVPAAAMLLAARVLIAQSGRVTVGDASGPGLFASSPDRFFTSDSFRIRYRDIGNGEAVLLLHGRSESLDAWRWMADSLALDRRVVAIDFRGAGQSTKSGDPSDYGPSMAHDVIGVLDHLHIARAHLVGHSLGAVLAAYVAAHHPERVLSVSLLAGAFYPDSVSFATATAPYLRALESGGDLRAYYRSRGASDSLAAALSTRFLTTNDVASLIAATRAAPRLILPRELVSTMRMPTLVAVGTRDENLEVNRRFASEARGARFVELAGADHNQILQRTETLEAIREQLRHASERSTGRKWLLR